jgi:UDPglucose 6-dehydrogenase
MFLVYHGAGYTGYTGAMFAARAGHQVLIYEADPARVAAVNSGQEPVRGLFEWLGGQIYLDPHLRNQVRATNTYEELYGGVRGERIQAQGLQTHLFALPTERDGEPMFELLNAAILRVVADVGPAPLVISVESTVHPDFTAQLRQMIGRLRQEPYTLIIAPRRDWFVGMGHDVESCERVIGVDSAEDLAVARAIYSPISRKIHWTDTETAEIVKQLENAQLYAGLTFLMGFALSYRDKNVREIIRLAGTHWRLPAWHLTLGVAGYCVPLGMKYLVRDESNVAFEYGQMALETEVAYRRALVDRLLSDETLQRIAILGISDKPNQRIQHLSPSLALFHELKRYGRDVLVHDEQFTAAELGIPAESWIRDLELAEPPDAVVVHTPYPFYRRWLPEVLNARLVVDGPGIFEVDKLLFERRGVTYFRVGDAGWLTPQEDYAEVEPTQ